MTEKLLNKHFHPVPTCDLDLWPFYPKTNTPLIPVIISKLARFEKKWRKMRWTLLLGKKEKNKIKKRHLDRPILFLIYINDFHEYLTHSTLRLFADDSIIYKEIRSSNDTYKLQSDLDAAAKWEQDWLMSFHPDKCSVLQITTKKQPIQHNYILHGHTLTTETSTKYLGVTIQNNLKWNEHINIIASSATKQLNFLKRNLKVTSSKIKERAYQSIVRPKLEYNCCTWDPHHQYQIHQLEMVQRRAARYVTNRYHNTSSVNSMLQDLNWPTLQQRRLRTRLIFFYKITHNLVAIHPSNLLFPIDSRTSIITHTVFNTFAATKTHTSSLFTLKLLYSGTSYLPLLHLQIH